MQITVRLWLRIGGDGLVECVTRDLTACFRDVVFARVSSGCSIDQMTLLNMNGADVGPSRDALGIVASQ